MRARHRFDDIEDYRCLLDMAAKNASKDDELTFVHQMHKAFKRFSGNAFLSDAQYDWLVNIAERD